MLTSVEKELIDKLMDEGPILCGLLDIEIVQRLLSRGLVYLDVPANSADFVFGLNLNQIIDFFVVDTLLQFGFGVCLGALSEKSFPTINFNSQ
jgi:hypothetical protein